MVNNGKVQVIRFFSKALVCAQLNWSSREKEMYFGVSFLRTCSTIVTSYYMNLTYFKVTLTGKVHRWKLYLQGKDFHLCHVPGKKVYEFVPDELSRLCDNHMPANEGKGQLTRGIKPSWPLLSRNIVYPTQYFTQIATVHNSMEITEVQGTSRWSCNYRPHYHPVHTSMPMLSSHESTTNPHQDASFHMRLLQSIRESSSR